MKNLIIIIFLGICSNSSFGQANIFGSYEQQSFIAPDEVKDSDTDVTITKDPQSNKKIWINNLVYDSKIYAVLHTKGESSIIYKIPPQIVNGYSISIGCVVYDVDDQKISISINNKENCYGLSQSDYDKSVSITKDGGIQAGNTQIGSNGTIKTESTNIDKNGVKVDMKKLMAGVQYTGQKANTNKNDD
jgi:hypothetical protein